jgi:Cys-tRNA(Pro) deacylase
MASPDYPVTQGVRFLREHGIPFVPHLYPYVEHGGTAHAAASLGVDEHAVVKTLIMMTEARRPLIVLMHGDREVSTKQLAREVGARRIEPADVASAHRFTGYQVGGISPFGTRITMPVYGEHSLFSLPRIYINGGKRGFLVEIDPAVLRSALGTTEVHVALASAQM